MHRVSARLFRHGFRVRMTLGSRHRAVHVAAIAVVTLTDGPHSRRIRQSKRGNEGFAARSWGYEARFNDERR